MRDDGYGTGLHSTSSYNVIGWVKGRHGNRWKVDTGRDTGVISSAQEAGERGDEDSHQLTAIICLI